MQLKRLRGVGERVKAEKDIGEIMYIDIYILHKEKIKFTYYKQI